MSVTEEKAYPIMKALDVDYVLVIFGGFIGYSGDDINKFLWMVRISGGIYPEIKEPDYFTPRGEYRVDAEGSPVLLNSLMYKVDQIINRQCQSIMLYKKKKKIDVLLPLR